MPDTDNIEIVRRGYEAFNSGGPEAVMHLLDPEIQWGAPEQAMEGDYHGHDGVRKFWSEFTDSLEHARFEPEDFIEVGDRVLVPFRFIASPIGVDVQVEERWAAVWTLKDGKAVRLEQYTDVASALEALGLDKDAVK